MMPSQRIFMSTLLMLAASAAICIVIGADAFTTSTPSNSNFDVLHSIGRRNKVWLSARPTKNHQAASVAPSLDEKEAKQDKEEPAITQRFLELTQNPNVAIVIDVENVRGKTNFELDHADFLDRVMVWTSLRNYAAGRTIAVVDHGSKSTAHLLHHGHIDGNGEEVEGAALCVAFAGPHVKADDIIARDVRWLLSSSSSDSITNTTQHVVVITADQELAWRCRSATYRPSKHGGDGTKEEEVKANSVLRSFSTDEINESKGGGGNGKQGKKKDRAKQSRAARKRQYLESQEKEQSDEGDSEEEQADDTNATNTVTSVNTIEEQSSDNIAVPTVEVIAPQRFLEDLEQALLEWLQLQQQAQHSTSPKQLGNNKQDSPSTISINNIPIPTPVTTLQNLFQLRGQILTVESALRKKCSLQKRHTLTGELRKCKEEWKEMLSSLDAIDNFDGEEVVVGGNSNNKQSLASSLAWSLSSTISSWENVGNATTLPLTPLPSSPSTVAASSLLNSWEQLTPKEQEKLLMRWGKRRGRQGTRREKTEDRIVLAERLRRQLELILGSNSNDEEPTRTASTNNEDKQANKKDVDGGSREKKTPLSTVYAGYINDMLCASN